MTNLPRYDEKAGNEISRKEVPNVLKQYFCYIINAYGNMILDVVAMLVTIAR